MFGYVTIGKKDLTEEEYKTFSSYYCGVCRATGKGASQLSRLGLSYDITFLALVLSSLTDDGKCEDGRCMLHPLQKRGFMSDIAIEYAACAGVLLTYLKLKDDLYDDKSIKALIGTLLFHGGNKKAKAKLPGEYLQIKKQLDILSSYEKEGSDSIDDTSEAFARILECLFTPDFIEDEKDRRKLAWLGYNLGRWIYAIDAVNDFNDDKKSGAYNPFVKMGYTDFDTLAKEAELSLTLTLEGIASAFELIDFKRNRDLIGKIIYISLKEKQQLILSGQGKGKDESIPSSRRQRKCRRGNCKKSI